MRANALEQMKAVETHARLGCRRIQPGRRDRALPGAPEVPLLARDKAWDRIGLRHRTTQPRSPLVPEEVVPQFDGLVCSIGRDRMALH